MTIITQNYLLTANDEFPIEERRWAMGQFVFGLGVAIDTTHLFGPKKELNYLSVKTLYPEHNESLFPLLLADQLRLGIPLESLMKEDNLRRIYQLGRASFCIRCIPDYEERLDDLHFIFNGGRARDIKPAVKAIEGLVTSSNKEVLEFRRQ